MISGGYSTGEHTFCGVFVCFLERGLQWVKIGVKFKTDDDSVPMS